MHVRLDVVYEVHMYYILHVCNTLYNYYFVLYVCLFLASKPSSKAEEKLSSLSGKKVRQKLNNSFAKNSIQFIRNFSIDGCAYHKALF